MRIVNSSEKQHCRKKQRVCGGSTLRSIAYKLQSKLEPNEVKQGPEICDPLGKSYGCKWWTLS